MFQTNIEDRSYALRYKPIEARCKLVILTKSWAAILIKFQQSLTKLELEQSFSGPEFNSMTLRTINNNGRNVISKIRKENKLVFKLWSSDVWPSTLSTEFTNHYSKSFYLLSPQANTN